MGAKMMCSMGSSPASLTVLPVRTVQADHKLAATIMDHMPMVNIASFGMCQSPSNPQVIAATAAALGVLTPQPCLPMTMAPWIPSNTAPMIDNQIALDNGGKCLCLWLGNITISDPGQTKLEIP
jgi:hypothetical protein